jgi:hypothetical protein
MVLSMRPCLDGPNRHVFDFSSSNLLLLGHILKTGEAALTYDELCQFESLRWLLIVNHLKPFRYNICII